MESIKVDVINKSKHELPKYSTELSAGMDLRANLDESISIKPGERALIPTGIYVKLPEGYEAQIRPRSGLALKHGVTVLNSPGTIDADYTGGIGVVLINHGKNEFTINDGERVAQMVVARYSKISWNSVNSLDETERGSMGFGHTGVK